MRVSVPKCMPVMTSLACEDISNTCNGLDMALLLSRDAQVQPRKSLPCGNTRVCPSGAIWAALSEANIPPQTPPPRLPNTWKIPVQVPRRCNVVVSSCGIWIQITSTQNPARKPSQIPPHTPHSLRTRGHCRPTHTQPKYFIPNRPPGGFLSLLSAAWSFCPSHILLPTARTALHPCSCLRGVVF